MILHESSQLKSGTQSNKSDGFKHSFFSLKGEKLHYFFSSSRIGYELEIGP